MLDTSGDAFSAGTQTNKEEREFFCPWDNAVVTTLCSVSWRI